MKRHVIRTFDDIIDEARMLPDLNKSIHFEMDTLESSLFSVAEKHGVIDEMFNDEVEHEEEEWDEFWE